jgi:hypothetical protein
VVLADLRADHLALQHAQPPVGLLFSNSIRRE